MLIHILPSPIRRYPDYWYIEPFKAVLHQQTYQPKHPWQEMGIHCSHEKDAQMKRVKM